MGENYEDAGKRLLTLIRNHDREFYTEIKRNADYPDDTYRKNPDYKKGCDRAEFEVLKQLCEAVVEELDEEISGLDD